MNHIKAKLGIGEKTYTVDNMQELPVDKFTDSYANRLTTVQAPLDRCYHVLCNVETWAKERGIAGGNGIGQLYKLAEELGEVASAVAKNNRAALIDGIGDMLVVMTVWSLQTSRPVYYSFTWTQVDRGVRGYRANINEAFTTLFEAVNTLIVHGNKSTQEQIRAFNTALMQLASCYGLTLIECLEAAYDEIKNRKGKTVNGVFIKEG